MLHTVHRVLSKLLQDRLYVIIIHNKLIISVNYILLHANKLS